MVQIGFPRQVVELLPSTSGSQIMAVLPEGCAVGVGADVADCGTQRGLLYQPNSSISFQRIGNANEYFSLPVLAEQNVFPFKQEGSAVAGFDNVTLGWLGKSEFALRNATVFGYAVKEPFIGLLGLSSDFLSMTSFYDNHDSLLVTLRKAGAIASSAWSYTAGAHYRGDLNSFGSLTFGGMDTSRFDQSAARVSWKRGVSDTRDLLVTLSAISVSDSVYSPNAVPIPKPTPQGLGLPINMFVDSTLTQLYLPQSICEFFETTYGLAWDDATNLYLLNDSQHDNLLERNPSVTFVLESTDGSINVTLPYGAFDLTAAYPLLGAQADVSNTSRYFPLQPTNNASNFILGRTFLQEAYLTVDYDRNNFSIAPATLPSAIPGSSQQSSIVPILPPNYDSSTAHQNVDGGTRSRLNTATIAGIVVGAAAVVAVLVAVAQIIIRRRDRSSRARRLREEHEQDVARLKPEIDGEAKLPCPVELANETFRTPQGTVIADVKDHNEPHGIHTEDTVVQRNGEPAVQRDEETAVQREEGTANEEWADSSSPARSGIDEGYEEIMHTRPKSWPMASLAHRARRNSEAGCQASRGKTEDEGESERR